MKSTVSVVIPCFNEGRTIFNLLNAISGQTYPSERIEVVIADGLSTDGTRDEINRFRSENPQLNVKLVENPKRIIPAGVNKAIQSSTGSIIVRLDGHSRPRKDYIARCVADLEAGLGDNVGGVWEIKPAIDTLLAKCIALAAAHPLGVGDAHYRLGNHAGPVDTVPFGSFKRTLYDRIGGFDEKLLANEDYEFNTRIRNQGGIIWLDPEIKTEYLARSNLAELGRQYFRYGYWKFKMLRKYPRTLRWRQAIPPLFVLSIPCLALSSFLFPVASLLLAIEILLYLVSLLTTGSIIAMKSRNFGCIIGFPASIATMHIAWGAGFLWSMIK